MLPGLLFAGGLVLPVHGGTILGKVTAQGPKPPEAGDGGQYQSRRYKFAERLDYGALRDFVVYIDQPVTNAPPQKTKPRLAQIVQRDATFRPHVLPILVGTTVEFPNDDEIFHNVFSVSPSFDLDLYKGNPKEKRVTFEQPGRVNVFCAVHSKMSCVILVLENPFFATSDDKGRYRIEGIPPGNYRLKAWHERLPSRMKTITLPENGEVEVDFVLGFGDLPSD